MTIKTKVVGMVAVQPEPGLPRVHFELAFVVMRRERLLLVCGESCTRWLPMELRVAGVVEGINGEGAVCGEIAEIPMLLSPDQFFISHPPVLRTFSPPCSGAGNESQQGGALCLAQRACETCIQSSVISARARTLYTAVDDLAHLHWNG